MKSDKLSQLPKGAKRVFKGQIFDVYQWDQQTFDNSTKIFEILVRPDTVQTIAVVGDKILIQEQEQPNKGKFISLPGGRLEEGEQPLEGAQRELLEETGYASNDWVLWKTFEPTQKMLYKVYIFIARNCVLKTKPKLEVWGEKITNKLVSFDEFLLLSEDNRIRQKELGYELMRMRLFPAEKQKFKTLLFK